MDSKKVILNVIPHYGHGGAQKVCSQVSAALRTDFHVIEIVFDQSESDMYGSNASVVSLDVPAGGNFIMKGYRFVQRCLKLRKIKHQYKAILSISHLEGANFVNILSGGRIITCVHGSKVAYDSNRRGLIRFIENRLLTPFLYNLSDHIVTVSDNIRKELIMNFGIDERRIGVIKNAVDFEEVRRLAREDVPIPELFDLPALIFAGRLAPQKNPIALLDIFKVVIEKVNINLILVGDGPLRDEMLRHCRNLDIPYYENGKVSQTGAVHFLGFQKNPFKYISRSDAFILTSDFEGYPLILCEALACRIPVLATDCPTGTREILDPLNKSVVDHAIDLPQQVELGILLPLLNERQTYKERVELCADSVINVLQEGKTRGDISFLEIHRFYTEWKQQTARVIAG